MRMVDKQHSLVVGSPGGASCLLLSRLTPFTSKKMTKAPYAITGTPLLFASAKDTQVAPWHRDVSGGQGNGWEGDARCLPRGLLPGALHRCERQSPWFPSGAIGMSAFRQQPLDDGFDALRCLAIQPNKKRVTVLPHALASLEIVS